MSKLITKDLTIANDDSVLAIFATDNGIDPFIKQAQEEAKKLMEEQDVSTQKGRDKIRADAYKFSKLKAATDKLGEGSIADHNKIIKAVNSNRKAMRDKFDILRDQVREPLTKWEKEEEEFKAFANSIMDALKSAGLSFNSEGAPLTLDQLQANKQWLESVKPEDFRDYKNQVVELLEQSLKSSELNIAAEEKRLADAEELKRLQEAEAARLAEEAAKAEAERLAEEKRLAEQRAKEAQARREQEIKDKAIREQQEAAERQQREAEMLLQAERDKAEQQRLAAKAEAKRLEHEKQQAVEAEQAKAKALADQQAKEKADREAKERAAKAEEERLLKDRAHKGRINKAAKEDFMKLKGVDEELAIKLVKAIVNQKISNISISYT